LSIIPGLKVKTMILHMMASHGD